MHRAIAALELPSHFEVIVVPSGKPQTKPRALNYAVLWRKCHKDLRLNRQIHDFHLQFEVRGATNTPYPQY